MKVGTEVENINKKIIEKLFEMQDLKYKKFHSNLCPGTDNIIGIQVPKLRNIAKEIAKSNNWKEFLNNTENKYYEETVIEGLIIGYLKKPFVEKQEYLDKFIPKIDNWAVCDTVSSSLKVKKDEKEKLWNYIQKYTNSQKEFEVRFVVVVWLFHFMDGNMEESYIDKILSQLETLYNEKYYTKMAIAWLISIGLIKHQNKTLEYLKTSKLDDFTYNKALQKAIESYRINEKMKDLYRSMKRK